MHVTYMYSIEDMHVMATNLPHQVGNSAELRKPAHVLSCRKLQVAIARDSHIFSKMRYILNTVAVKNVPVPFAFNAFCICVL